MMGRMGKRITSFLLACMMLLSLFPAAALAADDPGYKYDPDTHWLTITGETFDGEDFHDAEEVEHVFIGSAFKKGETSLGAYGSGGVFAGFSSLREFVVDQDNESLKSEDGVLFNKNGNSLCYYPAMKEDESYIIPAGVEKLYWDAFRFEREVPLTVYASKDTIAAFNKNFNRNLSAKLDHFGSVNPYTYIPPTGITLMSDEGALGDMLTVYADKEIHLSCKLAPDPGDVTVDEGYPVPGYPTGVRWECSDKDVLELVANDADATATVTAKKEGTATVTVTTEAVGSQGQPLTRECKIRVVQPVDSFKIVNPDGNAEDEAVKNKDISTTTHDPVTLSVQINSDATNKTIEWTIDKTDVATLEEAGDVRAAAEGDGAVFTVDADENGISTVRLVPWKNGTVKVTAKAQGVAEGTDTITFQVTFTTPATGVTLTPSHLDLVISKTAAEGSETLTAILIPTGEGEGSLKADPADLTWESGDGNIVKVEPQEDGDSKAIVTALAPGETTVTVTVTTDDGKTYTAVCPVTVTAATTGLEFVNQPPVELYYGSTTESGKTTVTVTRTGKGFPPDDNSKLVWKADPADIVSMEPKGETAVLTPNKAGSATVEVFVEGKEDEIRAVLPVEVYTPAAGVSLSEKTMTLPHKDATGELTATVLDAAHLAVSTAKQDVTWEIVDGKDTVVSLEATVDKITANAPRPGIPTATITAIKAGTATIRATAAGTNYSETCTVTVLEPATGVALNPTSLSLTLNHESKNKATLTVSPVPPESTDTVTWSSGDPNVATVTPTPTDGGKAATVTAAGAGTTQITATTSSGKTASCTVTVGIEVKQLLLNKTEITLVKDDTETLIATVYPSDATPEAVVTWKSSNVEVATVGEENGAVTAVNKGKAIITATATVNGTVVHKAECAVTVVIPTTEITLLPEATTLDLNGRKNCDLIAKITPDGTTDEVSWSFSGGEHVKFGPATEEGSDVSARIIKMPVTAVSAGTATVTVTSGGKSASCVITVPVPVTGVSLNTKLLTMEAGERKELTATVEPANADNKSVTWSSSDTTVAAVDDRGIVAALKPGKAIIGVKTADGGREATCELTVRQHTEKLELDHSELELYYNADSDSSDVGNEKKKTAILTAKVNEGSPGSVDPVTWKSSNDNVARVDAHTDGTATVTAVSAGTAVITATSGTASATCAVTVTGLVESISLSPSDMTVRKNDEVIITAAVSPADASNPAVDWKVEGNEEDGTCGEILIRSDNSVTVKALKAGDFTVTATARETGSDVRASCKVHVIPVPVTGISISPTSYTMELGEEPVIIANVLPANADGQISWEVSDEDTLECTANLVSTSAGVSAVTVKAKKTGTAVVTAKAGEYTASCTVEVKNKPVKSVTLTGNKDFDLNKDTAKQRIFTAKIDPKDATNVTVDWTSSDPNVATVGTGDVGDGDTYSCDASGGEATAELTAKGPGSVTITATARGYGCKDVITFTVPVAVEKLELEPKALTLVSGETARLRPLFTPANADNREVEWKSDNTIVTVDSRGVVTAKKVEATGEAIITATSKDGGKEATCGVIVYPAPASITISSDNSGFASSGADGSTPTLILAPGASAALSAKVAPDDVIPAMRKVKWTVKNDQIVELIINSDGTAAVKALSNGVTTVTAATDDGKITASCTVRVETAAGNVFIRDLSQGKPVGDTMALYTDEAPLRLQAVVMPESSTYKDVKWESDEDGKFIEIKKQSGYVEIVPIDAGTANVTVTVITDGGDETDDTAGAADDGAAADRVYTTFAVEVRKRAEKLKMEETLTLAAKADGELTATVDPDGAYLGTLRWTSSDPKVAKVTSTEPITAGDTGAVTGETATVAGISEGNATITATSVEDGRIQAQCVVQVYEPLETLKIRSTKHGRPIEELELSALDINNGPAAILEPHPDPDYATVDRYKWKSSDEEVVSVSEDGKVYVHGAGRATITLTAMTPESTRNTEGTEGTENANSQKPWEAMCTVTVEAVEPAVEQSAALYTPGRDPIKFTVSPIDEETSQKLKWTFDYPEADGSSRHGEALPGKVANVEDGYDPTTHTYTYSITPSINGKFTVAVSLEQSSKTCEAFSKSGTFTSLCDPILGVEELSQDTGESLTAKVNNENHTIKVAGYVTNAVPNLNELIRKLKLKLYEDENTGELTVLCSPDGSEVYVLQNGRQICKYELYIEGIVPRPENIQIESSIELTSGDGTVLSLACEEDTKQELLNAAVKKVLEDVADDVKISVKLEIALTKDPSATDGNKLLLNLKPTYTISSNGEDPVAKPLDELAVPITISVKVPFKPEAIIHTRHDGTHESLTFTVVDNGDETFTVSWQQESFSEVRLLGEGEARSGAIRFEFADGSFAVRRYGEADVGREFKADESSADFTGWAVADKGVFQSLTDQLLTAINGTTLKATPVFANDGPDDPNDNTDDPNGKTPSGTPATPNSGPGTNNNAAPSSPAAPGSGAEKNDGTRPTGDAATTQTVKNSDGSTATTVTTADGSRGETVTNADGSIRSASASVSAEAVKAARQNGKPVTVPVQMAVSPDAKSAAVLSITLPEMDTALPVRLAIPAGGAGPATVAVLVLNDGSEEVIKDCIVTDGAVVFDAAGDVRVKLIDNSRTFDDVSESFWGGEAVRFVAARGIFSGVSERAFAPNKAMSRGMLSQVLYNFHGGSGNGVAGGFPDVTETNWFCDAVNWCAGAGLMYGYPDGSFGGNRDMSRQELIACLYRYAQHAGLSTGASATLDSFPDGGSVQSYAKDAMSWAVGSGLIVGTSGGALNPGGPATRAQVAAIMMRLCYLK